MGGDLESIALVSESESFWVGCGTVAASLILMAASAFAQQGAMSPYQDEQDGVSAGGKWMEFRSEDKMTGAKKVRFELLANNYFREDPDYKPRVEIVCTDGKYQRADFNPGAGWDGRIIRASGASRRWKSGFASTAATTTRAGTGFARRFLSMDKGTVRGTIGAQVFNVEVRTRTGYAIAEFSPAGLNLDEVRHACDLTPHKP